MNAPHTTTLTNVSLQTAASALCKGAERMQVLAQASAQASSSVPESSEPDVLVPIVYVPMEALSNERVPVDELRENLSTTLASFQLCLQLSADKFARKMTSEITSTLGFLELGMKNHVSSARLRAFELHGDEMTFAADALRHITLAQLLCKPLIDAANVFDVLAIPYE